MFNKICGTLLTLCFGLCLCSSAFSKAHLMFAIDLVRHGDRTPILPSPGIQRIWPEAPGQLTPKGMQQAFHLGQQLRAQYVDQLALLPHQFNSACMKVRSSNYDRTLMTAQSLLLGLYPPGTGPKCLDDNSALPYAIQPIAIQTVPKPQDSLLVPNADGAIDKAYLKAHIYTQPKWQAYEQKVAPYFPEWRRQFQYPIEHLDDVIKLADKLYIEALYEVPHETGRSNQLSPHSIQTLTDAGQWAQLYLMRDKALSERFGHVFFSEVYQLMQRAIESYPESGQKYQLFVAHDSTIGPILNLLGYPVTENPPYVARLHFGVYALDNGEFEIRVTYQNNPIQVAFCHPKACQLKDFERFITLLDPTLTHQFNIESNTVVSNGTDAILLDAL